MAKTIDQQCSDIAWKCIEAKHYGEFNQWTNTTDYFVCEDCDTKIGAIADTQGEEV